MSKHIKYYVMGFAIFGILKAAYAQATNDSIVFVLSPLSEIITLVTGDQAIYTSSSGFFYPNLNITIDRSCSGINFWLMSFMLCLFTIIPFRKTRSQKLMVFPLALVLTYILTLFANASRILIAILVQNHTNFNSAWFHQAQGVFVYLTILILFYLLMIRILSKLYPTYAKLT